MGKAGTHFDSAQPLADANDALGRRVDEASDLDPGEANQASGMPSADQAATEDRDAQRLHPPVRWPGCSVADVTS